MVLGEKGLFFFFPFLKQISSYSVKNTLENLILQPWLSPGNSHQWVILKSLAEKLVNDFMLESSHWHLCESNNQSVRGGITGILSLVMYHGKRSTANIQQIFLSKSRCWISFNTCCCCCCCITSVMSNSVRPHRWQPTRLPHPWHSPGKNTGVGCHFPLQYMKVKSESEIA